MSKIKTEDLVVEIKAAINDLFVAEVTEEDDKIALIFKDGQKFLVSVEES